MKFLIESKIRCCNVDLSIFASVLMILDTTDSTIILKLLPEFKVPFITFRRIIEPYRQTDRHTFYYLILYYYL
jgi:hypothetical protein